MKQYHPIPWSSMVLDPIASNKSKNWSVPPFKRWFQSEWNVFCRFCILIQTIPNVGSGFRLHSLDFQCAPDGLTCGSHNPQGAGQAGQAVSSTRPMYNICLLWNSGRAVCHTNDLGLEPWHFGGTQKNQVAVSDVAASAANLPRVRIQSLSGLGYLRRISVVLEDFEVD